MSSSRVGFNVQPNNIIGHIGDDFYGSDDPHPTVSSTEGQQLVSPPGKGPVPPGQMKTVP